MSVYLSVSEKYGNKISVLVRAYDMNEFGMHLS